LADSGAVEVPTAKILLAAISDNALHDVPKEQRNTVRATLFKQILIHAV
jgi:transcriptional regulator CtsR